MPWGSFLIRLNWGGKSYPKCGWHHSQGCSPGLETGRKGAEHRASISLLPDWGCNVTRSFMLLLPRLPHCGGGNLKLRAKATLPPLSCSGQEFPHSDRKGNQETLLSCWQHAGGSDRSGLGWVSSCDGIASGSVCLRVEAAVELTIFRKRRPTNNMRNQKRMIFRNMKVNVRGSGERTWSHLLQGEVGLLLFIIGFMQLFDFYNLIINYWSKWKFNLKCPCIYDLTWLLNLSCYSGNELTRILKIKGTVSWLCKLLAVWLKASCSVSRRLHLFNREVGLILVSTS